MVTIRNADSNKLSSVYEATMTHSVVTALRFVCFNNESVDNKVNINPVLQLFHNVPTET